MRHLAWATLVLLLVAPAVAAEGASDGGVLVRVDGDVTMGPNETIDVLVLVGDHNHARIEGTVGRLVIIDGSLDLHGAVLEDLVLVNAHARLHDGSIVHGDVAKMESVLIEEEGSRIEGTVDDGLHLTPLAAFIFGAIFLVGIPLALILAGVVGAGLFPRQVQTVGRTLTRDLGATVLTALIVWIALPLVAFLALFTLIGIPTGLGILLVLLPFLWIAGFIAAGTRLGAVILAGRKDPRRERPVTAAALGILILVLTGLLPIVGGIVVAFAGILGGAAVVLAAWRASHARHPGPTPPRGGPPATPLAEGRPWDPGAGGS